MTAISESFLRVPYDLRPAKQAERRMLLDALQLLGMAGFAIRDYKYTGMGSVHFVDFILLHKYVGIQQMRSVEIATSIEKRVRFNKPFGQVEIEIGPVGAAIQSLSADIKHILWLDYDNVITAEYLQDVVQATTHLPHGSILLVTLDTEPPGPREDGPEKWRQHYLQAAGDYISQPNTVEDFAQSKLPRHCIDILDKAIRKGLAGRYEIEFLPMFDFLYKDGHRMLTVGGMLCTANDKRRVRRSRLPKAPYFRGDFHLEPYEIKVPPLTRKERLYLDFYMPCPDGWSPDDFELSAEDVRAYCEIYRFLPSYFESIL